MTACAVTQDLNRYLAVEEAAQDKSDHLEREADDYKARLLDGETITIAGHEYSLLKFNHELDESITTQSERNTCLEDETLAMAEIQFNLEGHKA
jgi:hypothetical protein